MAKRFVIGVLDAMTGAAMLVFVYVARILTRKAPWLSRR
jgi:hypothetical protein